MAIIKRLESNGAWIEIGETPLKTPVELVGGIDTSDANATSADLLTGKTAYVKDKKIIGAMPNRGTLNQTIDGINKTNVLVSAGYYSGGSVNFDSSAIEALLDAL